MPLSGVRITAIAEAHLQALIDDEVREGRRIEYKKIVEGGGDDRREFLADVSSFANAAGGDLLIGVAEKEGIAVELPGIRKADVDAETLRLEGMIRDGIEPRIPGIAIQPVELAGRDEVVLVVRIPRSWAAPHMVTFRGHSRFYSRNSAGKYPLDVGEIRSAFVASETARTQLRAFRLERLARIAANEGPVSLRDEPKTVLHVIPLGAVDPGIAYDVTSLADYSNTNFRPLRGTSYNHQINFDGALAFSAIGDRTAALAYTQVFRSGAIEGAESYMLRRDVNGMDLIPSVSFEEMLIDGLRNYLAILRDLEVPPPYLVGLSLLGVRGLRMGIGQNFFRDELIPIDRDDLIIPEALVEDATTESHIVLRPLIDAVWNAVGWKGSPNFTDQGDWAPKGQ